MGNAFIKESTLTAIANAIRAKTGGTATMLPSEMAGEITNMKVGGGSGSYVWTKQGMADTATEDTTGGTYTLTTPNTTRPSTEIEYSTTAPTYDSSKRQWIFANSTKVTLVNSDATLPSISGNVYVRVTSEPNVWYLVSAFSKGSSSPYLKNMTYSKKYTAAVDWAKKYLTDIDGDKYPNEAWLDGYYYKRTVADPIVSGGGTTWTQSNITRGRFNSVYYANGLWVASSTGLYYSTDGKTWTQSNITSGVFELVYYANGIWVASSNGNGLYYSTDGKTWSQSNITSDSFYAIYYANGLWVTGCIGYGLYYSTDGKTWSQSNITSDSFSLFYYANGLWIASNNNLHFSTSNTGLYYSTDGKNWTQSNVTSGEIYTIYYTNGLWVASCNTGLYYSTNGKNWSQSNVTSGYFYSVYYTNGLWIAGCNTGLYYSTDGKNWTQSNVTSDFINLVVYEEFKNLFIAFGDADIYYSTDGKNWVGSGNAILFNIGNIFFKSNGSCMVVSSKNNGLYYSTDGKNWSQSNVTSGAFSSVYYANGIWVASTNGTLTSDGNGLYYSETLSVEVDF